MIEPQYAVILGMFLIAFALITLPSVDVKKFGSAVGLIIFVAGLLLNFFAGLTFLAVGLFG